VTSIRPDPRSNERVRDLVLEHLRDRGWHEASSIAGDSAWPDIVAVEWELKLLRGQRAVEVDDMRRWRLSADVQIAGEGLS
jgi:hypothetical protein